MKRLILIDGSGLIYRGFYAVPPFMKSPTGVQTNAVFGFTNILLSILKTYAPDYIAVAFDKRGPTFRHHAYKEYKALRVKAPQELYDQIPLVKELVSSFNIPGLEQEGFEADDILATIAKKMAGASDLEILIVTGDFDLFQLVSAHTHILYPGKGFRDASIIKVDDIEKKYGLSPSQIPDFKGIAGDSSDNLPGVQGVGEKGATKLLQQYKTLENIYAHTSELREHIRDKFIASKDNAILSKKLAELHGDVPINFELEQAAVKNIDYDKVQVSFDRFGFRSLKHRIPEGQKKEKAQESLF